MIHDSIEQASHALQSAQRGLETTQSVMETGERWAAGAAGVALLAAGLNRRGISGALLCLAGADLVYHGVRGRGHLHDLVFEGLERTKDELPYGRGVMVKESIVVHKPALELYAVWRDFENLPVFMHNITAVDILDEKRSHWTVQGAFGTPVEWDAEVIADREGELIGWRTAEGETIAHAGSVRFEPLPDNLNHTRVSATLQYNPPAGSTGAAVAKFLGADPKQQVHDDLRRFKRFAESMDLKALVDLLHNKQTKTAGGTRQ